MRSVFRARCVFALAALAASGALTGCATTRKEEPTPIIAAVSDFMPIESVSQLNLKSGRYPNLFSTLSQALWVNERVAQAKLDAESADGEPVSPMLAADGHTIASNYYVVEINLGSQFPDSSIAYDVVGLRTIDAYLLLPDGTRIWPAQRVLGSQASEQSAGALKSYGRTNIVVFPKSDVFTGAPTIPNGTTGVQLVLDGFSSEFYFEWAAAPAAGPPPAEPESGGLTFSGLFEKIRELSRMTQ